MSTPIIPFAVWASGTNQNSIPANDNSLRNEILNGLVLSKAVTAQPASPSDGDIYILAATHTGTQWSTFSPDDLVIFKGGTWYAFAPVDGVVVNFDGEQEQYSGSSGWVAVGGGGGSTAWGDLTGVPANLTQIGALTDPGADRLLFWDDSADAYTHLTLGTNLSITGTTLDASGGGGSVAGSDKQVQYNNAGSFGAEAGFEYDQSTNTLTVPKINESQGSNIASATTTDIGAATGNFVHVTGTTTITGFGTVAAGARRLVVFDGALTLTHNATSLILPTGANITTAAGDAALCVSEGSGNWRVTHYQKKDGSALAGGGGGVTGFTTALNTASPNNTVNVSSLTASGGTTIQDVSIVPKSTGAIIGAVPDNSTTGGNRRGANAVDLQTARAAATNVANGSCATIPGGQNNTASGANSFAACAGSTASASGSIAMGNACVASNTNSIAMGNSCTASGTNSTAIGIDCTASGAAAIAAGSSSVARTRGSLAHASGLFGSVGEAQVERLVHRRVSSNSTPIPLSADGSAPGAGTCAILVPNSVYAFDVTVVAKNSTFGDRGSWRLTGQISQNANAASTAIDGTPTNTTIATIGGASGWSVAVSANTTLGSLEVTATGPASGTVRWVANIILTEVVG